MEEKKNEQLKPLEEEQQSVRFANAVFAQFAKKETGEIKATANQKELIQGYFIEIDKVLNAAEEERLRKNANATDEKYKNDLPVTWKNVDLQSLAVDLMHCSKIGLDMTQDNMLFAIPFKNAKKGKYDITLMEGYNGKKHIVENYAAEKPENVTVEVVYSTDKFRPIKKMSSNPVEGYDFEITDPFNRGEIKGAFAYIEYANKRSNKLIMLSMADIEKRKPKYASANFWGGKTSEWRNGKKVEVETDGWIDEMVRKTMIREAYSTKHHLIDPKKIDEHFRHVQLEEIRFAKAQLEAEKLENANAIPIDIDADVRDVSEKPPMIDGEHALESTENEEAEF